MANRPGLQHCRLPAAEIGEGIFALAAEIFPICRSITGDGVRETLSHLGRHIDLEVHEIPTGTQVLDWTVPREWNVRDAFIKDEQGRRVVDFRESNLHVLNYSAPIHAKMPLSRLREHLFTIPDQPDAIPYRTSYYAENWGFCLSHRKLLELPEGIYEVKIDASLTDGHLTYGEFLCPGESEEEILLSAHICHPSLANDNCSGLALLTLLAERLAVRKTRYSYRFLFAPGTIGAITWLACNDDKVKRIRHGLIVSGVGDSGGPTYKKSRRGTAPIDRAMTHVLQREAGAPKVIDFFPYGYDERQYCSPGYNLGVGLFQRSQFGQFPEYHNSGDNLAFIKPDCLASSYRMIVEALDILELDHRPRSANPKGEPQLGRRGLYSTIGGESHSPEHRMALLWIMNLADGRHSLLDIAERAAIPFQVIANAAGQLYDHGLLLPAGIGVDDRDTPDERAANSGQDWSFAEMAVTVNGQSMKKEGSL
jgi:aminopeptidase-like protein